jgi:putative oxidoreductase
MDLLVLLARILFVAAFLSAGVFGHLGPGRQMITGAAEARGLPSPGPLVVFGGAWIVVGSLLLLLGIFADLGALMLALFTISTATLMHPFWREADEGSKLEEQVQFYKDMALAGGALAFFVLVAGLGEDLGLTITGSLFDL